MSIGLRVGWRRVCGAASTMSASRAVRWAVLVACLAVLVATRVHTYSEPIERDLAGYAVTARELLLGARLYSGVWDHKPPAVHLTYAAAIAALGYGPQVFFVLGVLAAAVTLAGVYRCAHELASDQRAGLWAAVFWTATNSDLGLQANQPNVEVFMNACVVWSLTLVLRRRAPADGHGPPLLLGGLAAAATLYKPVSASQIGLLLAGYALAAGRNGRKEFMAALRDALVVVGAIAVTWAAVASWFALRGAGLDFYSAVFRYNSYYAGSAIGNMRDGLRATYLLPSYTHFLWPLVILSVAFLVSSARSKAWQGWLPFLGVILGTWVAVASAGHFFPHYYQLWLPLLAIGGGAGLCRLAGVTPRRAAVKAGVRRRAVAWAAGLGALALLLGHSLPQLLQPADRWPTLKYPHDGVVFSEIPGVAARVNDILLPGETFFHWGTDPGLYFYSGRRLPTVVTFCNPLFSGPLAEGLGKLTLSQLQSAPPEMAIVRRVFLDERPVAPVLSWILENYRPLPEHATLAFDLFALRGSELEARVCSAELPD